MEHEEKYWQNDEGELTFDLTANIWAFTSESRMVVITSWRNTKKGPMTEVVLEDGKKQVILEIIEKNFNEEWFSPKQSDKTAEKIMELCSAILTIDTSGAEYWIISSLRPCVEKLMEHSRIKCIHAYYGNGLFFGMTKNKIGQIKKMDTLPNRSMEFPATRYDCISD